MRNRISGRPDLRPAKFPEPYIDNEKVVEQYNNVLHKFKYSIVICIYLNFSPWYAKRLVSRHKKRNKISTTNSKYVKRRNAATIIRSH
jgi:hypothetical protein